MKAKKLVKKESEVEATPLSILREALQSKSNFMLFAFNPKNWSCLVAAALAVYGTYSLVANEIIFNPGDTRWSVAICFFSCTGMWVAAFLTLFQVSIQESINRFRALNQKLAQEVAKLGKQVNTLEDTSAKLEAELDQFGEIRAAMESYAMESGVEFNSMLKESTEIFDKIARVSAKNDKAVLMKLAADVEFRDGDEGMTFREFKTFCARVPKHYREKLKENQEARFKDIAGEDGIIQQDELSQFFEELVKDCCNPQEEG